jgi:hypothetical protein
MSPESKRKRRATRLEPAAAWDFGGAFGASLRAWNRRREEVPGQATPAPGAAAAAELPRALSSRTRGVMQ